MKDFYISLKKFLITSLIFLTSFSTIGLGAFNFDVKFAKADNNVDMIRLGQDMMPMMITATGTPTAAIKFEMYDTSSGTLQYLRVRVNKEMSEDEFDPDVSLAPLSTSSASGISIWKDSDGDGLFSVASDTQATVMPTGWTQHDAMTWSAQFSGIGWSIGSTFAARSEIFVVFNALEFASGTDPYFFEVQMQPNDMYVSGDIGYWPEWSEYRGPIMIGDEGSGGFGAPILISEIQVADDEFIELYNRDSYGDFYLDGWSLKYSPSSETSSTTWSDTLITFGSNTRVQAGGYYLVGNGSVGTTTNGFFTINSLSDSGGYVGLINPMGEAVDWVGYGTLATPSLAEGGQPANLHSPVASSSIERKAFGDSSYSTMISGGVHHYLGNSEDTNNNEMDFIIRPTSEPQNASSSPEYPDGGNGGVADGILINEIYAKDDASDRWFELYNPKDSSEDIQNYYLKHKGWEHHITSSIEIPAQDYLIIHWNQSGTNDSTNYYTGTGYTDLDPYGGDLMVKKPDYSTITDYVQYGGPNFHNESEAVAHGEWMDDEYVSNCLYGQSLGRKSTSGEDYNESDDWQTFNTPTPGGPNTGGDSTAPNTVTNVILSDPDVTNYNLDGNDIKVSWTPDPTEDPTFNRYEIYLLPATTTIDVNVHSPITSIYHQYQSTTTLFEYYGDASIIRDSNNDYLYDNSYKAYVICFDNSNNKSGTAVSSAALLEEEVYNSNSDNNEPYIYHMNVGSARTGSDLHIIARADDDRLMHPTNPLRISYKTGSDFLFDLSDGTTTSDCIYMDNNWYDCTIPDGGWSNTDVVGYILEALDEAGNNRYMSASWEADDSGLLSEVQNAPFYIDMMDSNNDGDADYDLAGYIYRNDGSPLATTTIFLEGQAIAPIQTASSGKFWFNDNTLDGGNYYLFAFKEGYYGFSKNVFHGAQNITMYLDEGYSGYSTGGESGSNPGVMWTAPSDGMTGAPVSIYCSGDCSAPATTDTPIIIAFDREMKADTINTQDASNADSNIYLTTNGNDRIGGKVYYDSTNYEARFYSGTADSLSLGTQYNIVVTQGVTDTAGNPIMGANSDGSFSNSFITTFATSTDAADFGTSGAYMPPEVVHSTPAPGAFNVARNASIMIEFDQSMDPTTINTDTIKLYPVTNSAAWTLGGDVNASVSLDQTTKKVATLNPDSDLASYYDWWVVKVLGGAKSSAGVYMYDPSVSNFDTATAYEFSFQINTGSTDSTQPQVTGTYPNNNDGITSSSTAVDVGIGALEVGFSESMDPASINTNNIKLLAGGSVVSSKVGYDSGSYSAKLMPYNALLSNTQYTFRISGCTDLAGNNLYATTTVYFKTGIADIEQPELMYANGDDYHLEITYSEPMNAVKQTDENWAYSVLNPANYYVNGLALSGCGGWSCTETRVSPYDTVDGTSLSGQGLSFSYDEYSSTVFINGFAFGAATDFQVFVDNVKDKSNNTILDSGYRASSATHRNGARAPLYDSTVDYYDTNMDDMGMMMAGAFPMNSMAGQRSMYFVDIPTNKSIPVGGKIVLTFPSGFDVSAAAKDPYSPVNNDINEWNSGTVGIASVIGNQSNRTVSIVTAGTSTKSNDYLHMDIKGIVNSNIPKDYNTEGYTVGVKTFTADGALLETIYTMPFYIMAGGSLAISGDIHGIEAGDSGTMTVFMGSPMTGPMETQVTVTGSGATDDGVADGFFTFTGLTDGEYHIFTEPNVNIGGSGYYGNGSPEPIWLNGASSTKDIDLTPESSEGAAVTVTLSGDFSTDGVDDDVDVFAGSPSGYRMKTLYNVGSTTEATTTLYLTAGDWMIGIGPAIPEGTFSGTIQMPDWMPPANQYYYSDGTNPGNVSFDISSQTSYTVSGSVLDGSSNPIADAEVWAYQPMGGYGGAFTKTATDGTFVLKIPVVGTYMIGAWKSGLPEPKEKTVDVTGSVSGLTITMTKPPYTISGKVLNSSGSAIAYAPVWAWQESSWGHADTMTDSAGNYILYVNEGTWHVETDAPGIGWLEYPRTLAITTASMSDINLSPSASTTYYTISGKVGINTAGDYATLETPLTNMPIRAVKYDENGVYQGKEFNSMTNSAGEYAITVAAGIYRVDIWTAEYGERGVNNRNNGSQLNEAGDDDFANNPANVDARSSDIGNADIVIDQSSLNAINVTFANSESNQEGYLQIEGVDFNGDFAEPNGFQMFKRIADLSSGYTVNLENGDYLFFVDVPGSGNYIPDADDRDESKDCIVVTSATSVNFTLLNTNSEMMTISGTVYAGTEQGGNELDDAWVWIGNPNNGFQNGTQSAGDGTYSLRIPSGTGYKIGADKPGYMGAEPEDLDATASATKNLLLTASNRTISGYIYNDSNSDSNYDPGEGVPNGFVRAETSGCSDNDDSTECRQAHSPVDGSGHYELGVVSGTWKVYGMADGYAETEYGSSISSFPATANVKLTTNTNWTTKSKKKQITPSSGGSLDDTAPGGTGVKLTIPPNALGNSSSAGNVNAQKTSSVTQTNSSEPVGGTGVAVSANDNSGQAITNLDDYVDVEMVLYKSEVIEAVASGDMSTSSLKTTKNAYWDSTANDWVNITTTRKAYYKSDSGDTEWTLYTDTATSVPAFESFVNKLITGAVDPYNYKLVYTSKTNHFTVFAVIIPFFTSVVQAQTPPDDPVDPPEDPPSLSSSGSFSSYCRTVEYGEWGICGEDGFQYREVINKSPSGCRLNTIQEADKKQACTPEDDEGEVLGETEESPEAVEDTSGLSKIDILYLEQGAFIARADIDEILPVMGRERQHEEELKARDALIYKMGVSLYDMEPRLQYALTNFIAYGSPDTVKLGAGERAGVVNSFKAAFGRLPETDNDWSDVIKIANGRWPSQLDAAAEKAAAESFKKIYLRYPNRQDPFDDAAVTVIAYGLRPANRNTESEKAAIIIFNNIYGYYPSSATDWDIVRAIAYSGATRDADTDGDGLGDKHEVAIGTNPAVKDSDGDGYDDGEEVVNGYDPLS